MYAIELVVLTCVAATAWFIFRALTVKKPLPPGKYIRISATVPTYGDLLHYWLSGPPRSSEGLDKPWKMYAKWSETIGKAFASSHVWTCTRTEVSLVRSTRVSRDAFKPNAGHQH